MPDRAEWEESQRREAKQRFGHGMANLQSAAVSVEQLTGQPAWDRYLSYLQAAVEVSEKHVQSLISTLASPNLVSGDDIIRLKIMIESVNSRIITLNACMSIPKVILDGRDASAILMAHVEGEA